MVRKQLRDLVGKIDYELQPIFTSKNIVDDLRETELKPSIVNQQSIVYEYKCDLCDTNMGTHAADLVYTIDEKSAVFRSAVLF